MKCSGSYPPFLVSSDCLCPAITLPVKTTWPQLVSQFLWREDVVTKHVHLDVYVKCVLSIRILVGWTMLGTLPRCTSRFIRFREMHPVPRRLPPFNGAFTIGWF